MDVMDLSNSTNALRISSSEFPSFFDDSSMIVDSNYEWRNSSNNIVTAADMMDFSEAPQSSAPSQSFGAAAAPVVSAPVVSLVSAEVEKTLTAPNPLLHSLPKVEIKSGNGFGYENGLRRSKRSAAIAASNILIPAAAAALQPGPEQKTTRRYTRRAPTGRNSIKSEHTVDEEEREDHKVSKNREAAQLFRQRQRDHIRQLEDRVEKLNILNQQYLSQHDQLTTEGKLIRQQLLLLREFVAQAMSFAFSNISTNVLYQQLQHLMAQQKLTEAAAASQHTPQAQAVAIN